MDVNTTYLWRWQASSSLGTNGQHGELPGCAALTVWRRSQRIPLWAGQLVYQHRVDQGHFPLSGDVVTGEISISGGLQNKTKHTKNKKKGHNQRVDTKESRGVWRRLTLEVRPPCSESQNQACPTILHQSISSEHRWDAHCCRGHRIKASFRGCVNLIREAKEVDLHWLSLPKERVLSTVHPGAEGQAWILPKRWNNQGECQSQKNKAGWQHNLHRRRQKMYFVSKKTHVTAARIYNNTS